MNLKGNEVHASDKNHLVNAKQSPPRAVLLRENFINLVQEVSIIGLRFVIQPSSPIFRRLFWIALILAGTLFTVYQIQDRISFYFSWPTNIGIRVEHVDSMRFPTVTICNENKVMKSTADNYRSMDAVSNLFPPLPDPDFIPAATNNTGYNAADSNWHNNYLLLSQSPSQAILSAYFDGKSLISDLSPSSDSLLEMVKNDNWLMEHYHLELTPTDIGFCYTFNSKQSNYTSVQPGGPAVLVGLQLTLSAQPKEYMIANSLSVGFRVMVYDQDEFPSMQQYGFRISPGLVTQVAVNSERKIDLPSPYGVCDKTVNYKQSQCMAKCLSDYAIKRCKCRDIFMPGNTPVCGPNELGQCLLPAINSFVMEHMASKCNCAVQCETLSYNAGITQSTLSDAALKYLVDKYKLNQTLDEMRRNYVVLEVFFSDLTITYIETTAAYTSLALLCDIGGALGLILGSTLLTVCEIADATLMSFLVDPFRHRQKADLVSPIQQQSRYDKRRLSIVPNLQDFCT